jgi:membrane protein implicated in regulation of membrane protease activity
MILDWIGGLGAWTWIILGVVLIGLELVAPGAFLLWLGLGCHPHRPHRRLGGAVLADRDPHLRGLPVGRLGARQRGVNRAPLTGEAATLNRRGEGLTGRVFTLEAPIVAGEGRVRIDDSSWRIVGPDTPAARGCA